MTSYIEAEYEDGYILREDEIDHSPYDSGRNVFHAILEKRPESIHGKMVRFSLVMPDNTYSVDWTVLPDNARPIRFKQMEADSVDGVIKDVRCVGIDFGYQYTNDAGENVQEVKSL